MLTIRSRTSRATTEPRRGFTLLELLIVVAIMGILLGAAVPAATMYFTSKARRATREALDELTAASAAYFHDTFQLPSTPADLNVDPGATGWSGPYMLTATSDPIHGYTDSALDAWSRPYRFVAQGDSVLAVESAGEDGIFGTEADLQIVLDITPIRREATLDELTTINQAVTLYNGQYLPDDPLPTSYSQILTRLVQSGFLPSGGGFDTDGWGDAYTPTPAGATPVVRIASVNLEGGGAGGNSGNGNGSGTGNGNGNGNGNAS